MADKLIKELFASDISREIEEVIKVDDTDEKIVRHELEEYVVTDSIRSRFTSIMDRYFETRNKPHTGIGVWVSGFFGSGKSSFAKYLGLGMENRNLAGSGAAELLADRVGDQKFSVLTREISQQIPTHAVIFDVSTDRGIRTGGQMATEIMYRVFLESLGYARDLDLSELEITLEADGELDAFVAKYKELFGKDWDAQKGKVATAVQPASRVMHELHPETYTTPDSWRESAMQRADITPGRLAERCLELMERRRRGQSLMFVIDEIGQFVARDVQKMLDLQAVVQSLGRVGRGKMWLVVTSQEKLSELVGGLDDRRVELARLMDRFPQPLQVHLEPADISEVTSKRILSKNAEAQTLLRELFEQHRGALAQNTQLSADITLPELSSESFINLYPLLPYQVDLIINVVSGLRTAGGASKHVGGANRTIIKLAQQLLIRQDVDLANQHVGALARIDQMYDVVSGNIPGEIRGKIDAIAGEVEHPLSQPVAKAICLLQYVQSFHRTPENIAATLHTHVAADSRLAEVKAALQELEDAHLVRRGDDGYRIPSPAEDGWERQRAALAPKPGDVLRSHAEIVAALWQPQPSHTLEAVKPFKAGLYFNGQQFASGDLNIHLTLAEPGELESAAEDARERSQNEPKSVFWVGALDNAIERETVEFFRSKEILTRKERGTQTKDEASLVAEEKRRRSRHQEELRRLLRQALLSGTVLFRGNDRSPGSSATDLSKAAGDVLAKVLPEVFDRFPEAAARVAKKDPDVLLQSENLAALTPVFTQLNLVREEGGKPVLNTDAGPLKEVLGIIENRTNYGETSTGRFLGDAFAKEPFGWEFDVVKLLVVSLLRAGKLQATSKGQPIDSAVSIEARNTFPNNNLFKQATFRPKIGLDFEKLLEASQHYADVFGKPISEIEQGAVARDIRTEIETREQVVRDVHLRLAQNQLPGAEILDAVLSNMAAIRKGAEDQAILTFDAAHAEIREATRRAAELEQALTPSTLQELRNARSVSSTTWPVLAAEPDLTAAEAAAAEELTDLLERELFFRELPAIAQRTRTLEEAHERRHKEAAETRRTRYEEALNNLRATPGWEQLEQDQREQVSRAIAARAEGDANLIPLALLREQTDACNRLLQKATEEMLVLVDGNRVTSVSAARYFSGGIESEEQLDAALKGLRDEVAELIAAHKKVLIQ